MVETICSTDFLRKRNIVLTKGQIVLIIKQIYERNKNRISIVVKFCKLYRKKSHLNLFLTKKIVSC